MNSRSIPDTRNVLLKCFELLKPAIVAFLGCLVFGEVHVNSADDRNPNVPAPKADGWKPLFDGRTTAGWRGFRRAGFPSECWSVEGGILKRLKNAREECGDVITVDQYDNFDLQLEWKIEPGGNSGVKYLVLEDRPGSWEQAYLDYHLKSLKKSGRTEPPEKLTPARWKYMAMGFELQLIDDEKNADAQVNNNRLTGGLYDLMAPEQKVTLSLADFNTARIVVRGSYVEHWINGMKAVEFERGSAQLQKLIDASKFQYLTGFGGASRGHIALQDHNSEVWFQNIKIRVLPGK
jgi:Domain of Unknown Function (DUF1080)